MSILLGAILTALTAYFLLLFFHLNKLERLLSETLQEVEIHLLQVYGEVSPKKVREVKVNPEENS